MSLVIWGVIAVLSVFVVWSVYDLVVARRAHNTLDDFVGGDRKRRGVGQRLGGAVAAKLPFLSSWQTYLAWAQLEDQLTQWSLAQVVFVALLLGCLGVVFASLSAAPIAKLAPLLLVVFPFLRVKTIGERAKKTAERALPEVAALIAAELSAGSSPEDAITRASQLSGPLSRIFDRAVNEAARHNRPLMSKGLQAGMLREVLSEMRLPALRGFAVQLDTVAQSGTEPAKRMQEVSTVLAADYRQRVREGISTLDKKLTLAVVVFYFGPFFLILLVGTFRTVLSTM